MIQFLLSRDSGSLWERTARQLQESYRAGHQVLLMVPEQYTLQAERDALLTLEAPGYFRLQVMSPSRLMARVFDRAGRDERVMVDERGQAMTLARALWALKDDLQYYGNARGKPGFAQKLLEAISELKSAGLSPEDLQGWLTEHGGNAKMHDLSLLYAAYEQAMAGQLADAADIEQDMLRRLETSGLYQGFHVLVYGFDLLTPPIRRLVTALAGRAGLALVALVAPGPGEEDADAFEPVTMSLGLLMRELDDKGIAWGQETLPARDADTLPALKHLRSQLLRLRQQVYQEPPEGLRLYAGKTPHEEVRRAAQQIHAQLAQGEDPRGIAVYYTQELYAPIVASVLKDYGIPHFVSGKQPLLAQPLVRCLLDALRCVQAAVWRPLDVFSYIKSPFSPLTGEEAWQLENYARRSGVRGKSWTLPFTRGSEEEKSAMEPLRIKAIGPVVSLRDGLSRARSAAASIAAVTGFLEDIQAQEKVGLLNERYSEMGLQEEAQRQRQVWEQLMGLFEQMQQLLGQERIPLGRFAEWLEMGLSLTALAALPPQQRSVQAGLLGQLMTRQPHSVYILGLNNGVLNAQEETLIADRERAAIQETLGTQLNLPLKGREDVRFLDLWKAVSAAGQGLHLSYALSDDQGKAMAPLIQLTRIKRMFPKLLEEGGAVFTLREPYPATPMVALDEIAALLPTEALSGPWRTAWAWLLDAPGFRNQAWAVLRATLGDDPGKQLDRKTARSLLKAGQVSVSRLERYASCPFRHFVEYGLAPLEREEWEVRRNELGIFCHAAMDGFVRQAGSSPRWAEMDREQAEAMMDTVLDDLTLGWEDKPWADTPRARQYAQSAKNICRRMAWSLTEARAHTDFSPLGSEMRFGMGDGLPPLEIVLEDGSVLLLKGTIDRVDTAAQEDGSRLLRVIDYKTGNVQFTGGDLEAGVQLQLMLYLATALTHVKDTSPAGALYQPLSNPLVEAASAEEALKKSREKLRLDGVLLEDADSLRKMDSGEPPLTLARLIKKDGEPKESGRLLSPEEMDALIDFALRRARELAQQIFSGIITRAPLIDSKNRAACSQCSYQGICRTETLAQERLKRRVRKVSLKELAQESLQDGGN